MLARVPDRSDFSYSVVIPVYNSQDVVGSTVDRVVEVFEAAGLRYQVVLVNDGSRDGSWDVIAERARTSPHVVALNLLRNYGQHHANLAGMRESTAPPGYWLLSDTSTTAASAGVACARSVSTRACCMARS